MQRKLFPTTVVGSYPQPEWLIDRSLLAANTPPRVRMRQLWRVAPDFLEQAQDDATLIAIRDQERAGIDIVSDGEMRRESYFNRFATALDGIDLDNPGTVISRTGKPALVPRVVGRVRRLRPVTVRDVQFLRANTDRQIKITVPGPFTMTELAQNDYYASEAELAGPTVQQVSVETAQSALDCSVLAELGGKTVLLGVLDLSTSDMESAGVVADRIRRALPYVPAERLVVAPDCGMKYLTRDVAFAKLASMVEGARLVRVGLQSSVAATAPHI